MNHATMLCYTISFKLLCNRSALKVLQRFQLVKKCCPVCTWLPAITDSYNKDYYMDIVALIIGVVPAFPNPQKGETFVNKKTSYQQQSTHAQRNNQDIYQSTTCAWPGHKQASVGREVTDTFRLQYTTVTYNTSHTHMPNNPTYNCVYHQQLSKLRTELRTHQVYTAILSTF